MTDTQEITALWGELTKFDNESNLIKAEKERIMGYLNYSKDKVRAIEDEIERRKESPEKYPVAAGAGTIEYLIGELNLLKEYITSLENEIANFDQPMEDVEESRDQLLFIIADKIGLEALKQMRTIVGKEMSKDCRLQHEAYQAQKERYEECKRTFGFTPDDRAFISHNKNKNQAHIDKWMKLCDQRNVLCELISALDPSDEDFGFDEDEE